MKEYQYRPLDDGEIRLLRLHPRKSKDEPLTGAIIHHKLENPTYHAGDRKAGERPYLEHKLAFEALSYHWGSDPRTPRKILIKSDPDGPVTSLIKLTVSLHDFLARLVLPDQDRLLWADAICINQVNADDNLEKGAQLKLMPDIYSLAKRVQIYLGEATEDSDMGINLIELIAQYSEDLDDTYATDGRSGLDIAISNGLVLPPTTDKHWKAMQAFLNRPWFRRVWIIQEFVYAAEVVMMCGSREIDWRHLWLTTKVYVDNFHFIFAGYKPDLLGRNRKFAQGAHEGARALFNITDLRMRAWGYWTSEYIAMNMLPADDRLRGMPIKRDYNAIVEWEKLMEFVTLQNRAEGKVFTFGRRSFLETLQHTNNFASSMTVDKLYALINIVEDSEGLEPVYTKRDTIEVVSTRFARHYIERGQAVHVISTAGMRSHHPKPGDRPSWVPEWEVIRLSHDYRVGLCVYASSGQKSKKDKLETPEDQVVDQSGQGRVVELDDADQTSAVAANSNGEAKGEADDDLPKLYNAAGNTKVEVTISDDGTVLQTKAMFVDQVNLVVPGKLALGCPLIWSCVKSLGPHYKTGIPLEEALWRTLIANRSITGDNMGRKAPDSYEHEYLIFKRQEEKMLANACLFILIAAAVAFPFLVWAVRKLPYLVQLVALAPLVYYERGSLVPVVVYLVLLPLMRWLYLLLFIPLFFIALCWLSLRHVMWIGGNLLPWVGVSALASTYSIPGAARFQSAFSLTALKYEFAVSYAGLFALVPLLARKDDYIAVLVGFDAPVILRPADDKLGHYRLVGEAYVHGIMDGEALVMKPVDVRIC